MSEQEQAQTEKVLERVKKMLALANDAAASEGERENAMRMAYKTLAKHNLSMLDVKSCSAQEERVSDEAKFVVYPWARQIANIVGELFFCRYYFVRMGTGKQAKHVFVGKASNATTASYMANFVVTSVLREAARLYGSAIAPEARNFATGVEYKLRERVREIKASFAKDNDADKASNSTALVLASLYDSERTANNEWMEAQNLRLRMVKSNTKQITDSRAFYAGKDFGAKVNLAPQVGTAKPNRQIA